MTPRTNKAKSKSYIQVRPETFFQNPSTNAAIVIQSFYRQTKARLFVATVRAQKQAEMEYKIVLMDARYIVRLHLQAYLQQSLLNPSQ